LVVGKGERWNDKLISLRKWAVEKMRPHPVKPAPGVPRFERRHSGPLQVPSDWMDPDRQRFLGAQCSECKQNQPLGVNLRGGLCGPCWLHRIDQRRVVNGPDDLPPAA
jgi:hypothetical protein